MTYKIPCRSMNWQFSSKIRVLLERLDPILRTSSGGVADHDVLENSTQGQASFSAQKRKSSDIAGVGHSETPSKVTPPYRRYLASSVTVDSLLLCGAVLAGSDIFSMDKYAGPGGAGCEGQVW